MNRKIIITRPKEKAREFARLIEDAGGEAVIFPTIEIVPAGDEREKSRIFGNLKDYDWLVLTSTNGVKYTRKLLDKFNADTDDLKVFPVGPKTKRALREAGFTPADAPEKYRGEGLVELLKDKNPAGKKVLLSRAGKGRSLLPEKLKEAGADVTDLTVYTSTEPEIDRIPDTLFEADAITFTSPSTFENLLSIAGSGKIEKLFSDTLTVCIGPVTGNSLRKAGFIPDIECENHTIEAMIDAVKNHFNRQENKDEL